MKSNNKGDKTGNGLAGRKRQMKIDWVKVVKMKRNEKGKNACKANGRTRESGRRRDKLLK